MSTVLSSQSSFLYEANWSPEIDNLLLGTLLSLKRAKAFKGTVFPSGFILDVAAAIEYELGFAFEWFEVVDRLHFLEKLYTTFKEPTHAEWTYWNPESNLLIVIQDSWESMLKTNPLVSAYYHQGDPAYRLLDQLFATSDVKVVHEKTAIVLSDTLVNKGKEHAGSDESVNGLVNDETINNEYITHAQRKLVFDEHQQSDRESTTDKGKYFHIVGKSGKLERKLVVPRRDSLPQQLPPKLPPSTVRRIHPAQLCGGGCQGSRRFDGHMKWW
ncbi:hypothetical protein SASPL_115333 [Salvia splendens]|uniref:Uncharacterized protein n=1 Tax=Salvia splendens TaxID=180675 RepID=A0A8X8Y7C6_SALSN|nr:uncharacterized protein LOC121804180 [Salvia splendens]KAG6424910.1 hypothetical protein SASPL_115333 [Salvia splendens]